jgi:hypothetical protein
MRTGECDVDCGREYEGQVRVEDLASLGQGRAVAVRCGAMRCLVAGRWSLVAGRWSLVARAVCGQHLVDCHDIHCPGRRD